VFLSEPFIELCHKVRQGNVEHPTDYTHLQQGYFPMTRLDLGEDRLRYVKPRSKVSLLKPRLLPKGAQDPAQPQPITSLNEVIEGAFPFASQFGPIGCRHAPIVVRPMVFSKLENCRRI